MNNYRIYLGLNDKKLKIRLYPILVAKKIVKNAIRENLGFGTLYSAEGVYTHDNGKKVTEKTLVIEYSGENEETVRDFCEYLKTKFNQESIGLIKNADPIEFV